MESITVLPSALHFILTNSSVDGERVKEHIIKLVRKDRGVNTSVKDNALRSMTGVPMENDGQWRRGVKFMWMRIPKDISE